MKDPSVNGRCTGAVCSVRQGFALSTRSNADMRQERQSLKKDSIGTQTTAADVQQSGTDAIATLKQMLTR
jgi:hypothetical protein